MHMEEIRIRQFTEYIQAIAAASLTDEVSATPKPGLVDKKDSGAHKDMDFYTFEKSTEAIVPHIAAMARLGAVWKEEAAQEGRSREAKAETLFKALRPLGMEAEKAMFTATCGVNTHKGMIFSMGLVAAAAGYCLREGPLKADTVLDACRTMCRDPLELDWTGISAEGAKTHGERLYLEYGIRGIRGEAADGFPSVSRFGLPVLRKLMKNHTKDSLPPNWNGICLQVLLNLMAQVDDTNVLYRTDYASLRYVRERAAHILTVGGGLSMEGLLALAAQNRDFIKRNISPGGCADLLAITLFLWRLEQFSF